VSRKTLTVCRVALALLALVAISSCTGRTGPDPQEFVAGRLTELQAWAGEAGPSGTGRLERCSEADPVPQVRAEAAELLGRPGAGPGAIEALAEAMRDSDALVRSLAGIGLVRADSERALLEALRTGPADPPDRAAWAALTLGRPDSGDRRGAEAALALTALARGSGDGPARARALEALGRLGRSVAREVPERALGDESWEVRAAAAGALARLQGESARDGLRGLAEGDPHETVRNRARAALKELSAD
jgi:HEAT repeat protein